MLPVMPHALVLSLAALSLAAPLHASLHAQQPVAPAGAPTDAAMAMLPMSSSAADARMHATLGQRALDMGHEPEAARHFQQALAADSTSAFAHLGAANASTSFGEYGASLKAAIATYRALVAAHAAEAKVAMAIDDFGSARRALTRRSPLVRQQFA